MVMSEVSEMFVPLPKRNNSLGDFFGRAKKV